MQGLDNWHIDGYNIAICHNWVVIMIIKTKIFEFGNGGYKNLSELAQTMGISVSQIYRVKEGKRRINQKFIIGAVRAFPKHKFEDLFYLAPDPLNDTDYYRQGSAESNQPKRRRRARSKA